MALPTIGTISRRRFARGIIASLLGGVAATLPWLTNANAGALIRRRASAMRIGRRYLAMLPSHADRSRLLAMTPMLDRALRAVPHEPAAAAALLRQGIEDDFRRADTVMVDGWVLAATEARLCAVIALA